MIYYLWYRAKTHTNKKIFGNDESIFARKLALPNIGLSAPVQGKR